MIALDERLLNGGLELEINWIQLIRFEPPGEFSRVSERITDGVGARLKAEFQRCVIVVKTAANASEGRTIVIPLSHRVTPCGNQCVWRQSGAMRNSMIELAPRDGLEPPTQ